MATRANEGKEQSELEERVATEIINESNSNEINITMTGIIGNIEPFLIGEEFELYKECLQHFLSLR